MTIFQSIVPRNRALRTHHPAVYERRFHLLCLTIFVELYKKYGIMFAEKSTKF